MPQPDATVGGLSALEAAANRTTRKTRHVPVAKKPKPAPAETPATEEAAETVTQDAPETAADSAAPALNGTPEGKSTGEGVVGLEKPSEPVSEKSEEPAAPPAPDNAADAAATAAPAEPDAQPEPAPPSEEVPAAKAALAALLEQLDPDAVQELKALMNTPEALALAGGQPDGASSEPEAPETAAEEPPPAPEQGKPAPGTRVRVNALPDLSQFDDTSDLDEITRRDLIENLRRAGQAARKSYEVTMTRHQLWEERVRRARAQGLPEADVAAVEAEVRWAAPEPEEAEQEGEDAMAAVPAPVTA